MKKTYMSPEVDIMLVKMQHHLLTGSKVYEDNADSSEEVLTRDDDIFDLASGLPGMPDY